jgi:monovalent cation:H+ antiporter-2, CPA2 family
MPETGLLVNLALALIAATIGGAVAVRLGQSPILGYVVAGVLIGPYTPGLISDPAQVAQVADIGLAFLLFAVGLQLSLRELLRVGWVALVGCTLQVGIMIAAGYAVGVAMGLSAQAAIFLGAFVSISSTTVMAKLLGDRGEVDSGHGLLAMAWATAQDLITIVLVVLLTGLTAEGSGGGQPDIVFALGQAVLFMAIVLPLGLFGLPWLLRHASLLRNREIFVLSVVAVALGTAFLSQQFGLSLALGAFLAGLLVSESELSYQALGELSPLRDVFAGLFFVFVGMLVDPASVVAYLPLLAVTLMLIVALKGAVAAGLAYAFRVPARTAVLAGVALAQAGEFSFLLARVGVENKAIAAPEFSVLLGAAALSIVLTPVLMRVAPTVMRRFELRFGARGPEWLPVSTTETAMDRRRFVLICGMGRVGRLIGAALERRGFPYRAIDADPRVCHAQRQRGVEMIQGAAENPRVLDRADVAGAAVLVVALPDPIAMRQVVDHARRANERLPIIARARSAPDREFLARRGVSEIVMAETEVALEMARYTLGRLGVSGAETAAIVQGLRRRAS